MVMFNVTDFTRRQSHGVVHLIETRAEIDVLLTNSIHLHSKFGYASDFVSKPGHRILVFNHLFVCGTDSCLDGVYVRLEVVLAYFYLVVDQAFKVMTILVLGIKTTQPIKVFER